MGVLAPRLEGAGATNSTRVIPETEVVVSNASVTGAVTSESMTKLRSVLGTLLFLVLVPGVVAGLIPGALTGWDGEAGTPVEVGGWALVILGCAVLLSAFARFALQGLGTPAPVAPTERLVVTGGYRYVRNPMYLAVVAIIVGQAGVLGSLALVLYGAAVWATVAAFVVGYEEPALTRQFGEGYGEYVDAVPRWLPRLTPWVGRTNPSAASRGRIPGR